MVVSKTLLTQTYTHLRHKLAGEFFYANVQSENFPSVNVKYFIKNVKKNNLFILP